MTAEPFDRNAPARADARFDGLAALRASAFAVPAWSVSGLVLANSGDSVTALG